ncbi:hypothetical protein BJP34_25380 [Moorena producens PAL-8-15-08-1]|uniref:Uncharacterized protein n=1 Tax=Moorena producens PAL-8-15-08-1 TaxID=1458985 RepID=A0A1D8TXG5_9CYAN|nr:hypothetical protein BJP34_25380 [Moorena producens PAL-8-15-08-1]
MFLGSREQGAGSSGYGKREQGAGSREQRIWEKGKGKREEGKNNVYLMSPRNAINKTLNRERSIKN